MPLWLQHILVVAIAVGALVVIVRQAIGTLRMRHGKIGSCCAKGCGATEPAKTGTDAPQRIVFLPRESLVSRARTAVDKSVR
jgi:hypothetical protein